MCSDSDLPKCSAGSIVCKNREQGEFHAEAATPAFLARDFDFAVMGGTDRFDDRESEPGPAAGAGAGLVGAIEAFEDVGQSVRRNAEAVVGDLEDRTIPLTANADLDHAAYWCVFDGVIDEVHNYLLRSNPVPRHMNSSLRMEVQPE